MTECAEHGRTGFGALLREVGDELVHRARSRPDAVATVDRSDWRRLFELVTPVAGESLRGLVARACRANHLPNSFGLLQHLGQAHRNRVNVSEDVEIDPTELAYAIRVDETEVLARRYSPSGRGHVLFHGLDVNLKRVETSRRRFSPTIFRREQNDRPHVHRAVWELRDIPFCYDGWDMLQDTCWCEKGGIVQRWSRTGTRVEECDKCGDPLARLEPVPVPERMRLALRVLQAVISPTAVDRMAALDALPEPLRAAERSELFRLITRLAKAISPGAADEGFEEPAERLAGLHAACVTLQKWPRGLDDVELPGSTPNSTRESIRIAWNRLAGTRSNRPSPDTYHGTGRVRGRPGPRTIDDNVGIRRATEIARLSPEVLHAAWEHGLVTRRERRHGERMVAGFDPSELVTFGKAWRERREPRSLADELGLPLYAIEQLAALRCVVADALAIPGTGPHFTPPSVADFHQAIENGRTPVADPVPLKRAMRLAGGRLKPWGPAFKLLLGRSAPYDLRDGQRLVDRLLVSKRDLRRLAALVFSMSVPPPFGYSDVMPQDDALEVLNASGDLAHLLRGLPSQGRNPKLYPVVEVEKRAAELVTIPEIAARLNTDPATAWQELRRRGVVDAAIAQGAWPRKILLELI